MHAYRCRFAIGALAFCIVWGISSSLAASTVGDDRSLYTADELAAIYRHSPLGAVPTDPTDAYTDDGGAAKLGQFLFFDRRLSANGQVSCATCHQPARAFTDGRRFAHGISVSSRNTPTLLDAAFNQWFFWDGRADSLWSQALQPFENPREAGSDRLYIAHLIQDDPRLRVAYQRLFGTLPDLKDHRRFPSHARPDADARRSVARAWARMAPADQNAINRLYSNLAKAIEIYERKLVEHDSAFDRYVAALKSGDPAQQNLISAAAKHGLKLFVGAANCELCHAGPTFSDGQFHNLGLPVVAGRTTDTGRADGLQKLKADPFNGIGPFSDAREGDSSNRIVYLPPPDSQLGAFKTPGLRNVALTAPYMHDGRFSTLEQVLDSYTAREARGRGRVVGRREETADLVPPLNERQKSDLVAFLETLTGSPLPGSLTRSPSSP